jgi:hypothetical protein
LGAFADGAALGEAMGATAVAGVPFLSFIFNFPDQKFKIKKPRWD